jgi:hypothetical protein
MKVVIKIIIIGIWVTLSAQQMVWKYVANEGVSEKGKKIVYSFNNNIICAGGDSYYPGYQTDIMFIGLNTAGQKIWGPVFYSTYDIEILRDMVIGNDGIIYGCGSVNMFDYLPNMESDFWVGAITTVGVPQWAYVYDEAWDDAYSVVQGRDGNIYACGIVMLWDYPPLFTNSDIFVLSLTPEGNLRWTYRYENGGYQYEKDDKAKSIVYGGDNNIYVAGYISSGEGMQYEDLAVLSFKPSRNLRWIYLYNGPANSTDEANCVIWSNNKIYVTGFSIGSGTQKDAILICLDTLGNKIWEYRYNSSSNSNDEVYKLIIGLDGNLYLTGYTYVDNVQNILVISLDTLGNERWVYKNRPGEGVSLIYQWDKIYITGYTPSSNNYTDISTMCLNNQGNELWFFSYNGAMNRDDGGKDIIYGINGNLYICGISKEDYEDYDDFIVINLYDSLWVNIKENKDKEINFPIPIFMSLKSFNKDLKFKIFDKLGRKINEPKSNELYFITFKKENKILKRKIIKIK